MNSKLSANDISVIVACQLVLLPVFEMDQLLQRMIRRLERRMEAVKCFRIKLVYFITTKINTICTTHLVTIKCSDCYLTLWTVLHSVLNAFDMMTLI